MLASSPGSPIFSMHARKEGEPGIQCHMHDVGPFTKVERVADRENCTWASAISKHSHLTWVKKKAILTISEGSTILAELKPTMTNGFEIEGLVARQAWHHFANVCHMTLDTSPSLVFSCKWKKLRGAWGQGYINTTHEYKIEDIMRLIWYHVIQQLHYEYSGIPLL